MQENSINSKNIQKKFIKFKKIQKNSNSLKDFKKILKNFKKNS